MSTIIKEPASAGFSIVCFDGSVGFVPDSAIKPVTCSSEDPPLPFEATFILCFEVRGEPREVEVSIEVSPHLLYIVGDEEYILVNIKPLDDVSRHSLWFLKIVKVEEFFPLFIPVGFFDRQGSSPRRISTEDIRGQVLNSGSQKVH